MSTEFPTSYDEFLQAVLATEMLQQGAVTDGVLALEVAAKERLGRWAEAVLAEEEPQEPERLLAARSVAALLPVSLESVLFGLRSRSDKVRFSLICALDAAALKRAIERLERELVSAVWEAAVTSTDSDVHVIAADFMAHARRKAVRAELERRDLTLAPDLFLWLLAKYVFGRRLPRPLARESFERKLWWRRG